MSEKKFIKGAIKRPGALTAKAKAAGQSTQEYAAAHAHDKGLTGQQARFAQTLNKVRKGTSPMRAAAGAVAAATPRDERRKTSAGYLVTANKGAVVDHGQDTNNPWQVDDFTPATHVNSPFAQHATPGESPHQFLEKII